MLVSNCFAIHSAVGDNAKIVYAKGSNLDADAAFKGRAGMIGKSFTHDDRPASEIIEEAFAISKDADGFQKIALKVGESKTVSFNISINDLKYYHSDMSYDWEPGEFEIMIGTDSQHVKMAKLNWSK